MSEPPVEPEYDEADDLFRTAELVLEHINLAYQQYSQDVPGRQFITFGGRGDTVHDCEQLSVAIEQIYSGLPGNQANDIQNCDGPKSVVFVIEVVRCIPTPTGKNTIRPPEGTKITEAGRIQARDAMILLEGGMNAIEAQQYSGGLADVAAGQPQGGYQGVILNLIMPVYPGPGA